MIVKTEFITDNRTNGRGYTSATYTATIRGPIKLLRYIWDAAVVYRNFGIVARNNGHKIIKILFTLDK